MNKSVAKITMKDADKMLKYYEETFGMEVIERFFAKQKGTMESLIGKLVLGRMKFIGVDIIITERYDLEYPEAKNIYLSCENSERSISKINHIFTEVKKDEEAKIFVEPQWNRTQTFYGSLKDKFGVVWEFKIGRK